jgi:hypothetical protein
MIALLVVLELLFGALRSFRIVSGQVPVGSDAIRHVEWIRTDVDAANPPRCVLTHPAGWACWVARGEGAGVVVLHADGLLWWRSTAPGVDAARRSARWGRLIVISGAVRRDVPVRVSLARPAVPAARMRAVRLETAPIPDAQVVGVTPHAMWIAGSAAPPQSWVEVSSSIAAPLYLPLEDVAAAPASIPLLVALSDARPLTGLVVSSRDQPAPGALVTLFRLIEPPPAKDNSAPPPRRVFTAETIAGDDGRFVLPALGNAAYEIVAWHPQQGRSSIALRATDEDVVVRLGSAGVVRGRVVSSGRAIEGVGVISVPDAAVFASAIDLTELKGGDARTGADGRFAVIIAPAGGGELRIGGGAHPVKRIPLPRSPPGDLDVGDVDLGQPIRLVVRLDRDLGCDLRAAGPVGRTGMQLIQGTRTAGGVFDVAIPEEGVWEISLRCGENSRSVSPSLVQVRSTDERRELSVVVR